LAALVERRLCRIHGRRKRGGAKFALPAFQPAQTTIRADDRRGIARDQALSGGADGSRAPLRHEREVRPLPFNKYPKELFPKFVNRVIYGAPAVETLVNIYGNEFSDMAEFEKRFSRFTR